MAKSIEKIEITKNKIRTATLKLMSDCNNKSEVTSRIIAKEAGVQLAMINYCFGSREALIFDVFQNVYSKEFSKNTEFNEIIKSDITPKDKLKKMHYKVIKFLLDNFVFSKAVTKYVILNRDLSHNLNSLPFVIAHYENRKTEQECKMISYELSSIMQLVVYRHNDINDFCGIDITDNNQLRDFVNKQIDIFLID